jgi:hypothetical protein
MASSPFAFYAKYTKEKIKYKKYKGVPLGDQAKSPRTKKAHPSFCVVLSKKYVNSFFRTTQMLREDTQHGGAK